MKILFLSPILPHAPVDGDKLRAFHLIRMLSKRHQVTLVACYAREEERADLSRLRPLVKEIHLVRHSRAAQYLRAGLGFFGFAPLNVAAYQNASLERLLARLVKERKFDLVFAYRLRMAPYALKLPIKRKVLDFTDCLSVFTRRKLEREGNPLKRWLWRREERRLRQAEGAAARDFGLCLVNSRQDAAALKQMALPGRARILALSNGVDFNYYHPSPVLQKDPASLVFVGNLAYPPNADAALWFSREVFPLILEERPKARFWIVGGNPPRAVERLSKGKGVIVTGFVPDTRPYVWSAMISVCPLRLGAGRQNKVLESFALGVPVVSTPLGAQGVEAVAGRHLSRAQTPKDFAAACLRLMEREGPARRMAKTALSWVRRQYRWEDSAKMLDSGLKTLACLALALCLAASGCMKRPSLQEDTPRTAQARTPGTNRYVAPTLAPVRPPVDPNDIKTAGDRLYEKGDFRSAVGFLREDVKKNPKDPKLWRHLGSAYGGADDYNNAIFCYRKSLQLNPADLKTYYNISLMLDYTGGFEEAEKMAKHGLKMDPANPEMHSSLGNILADKEDETGALKQYGEALKLKPDDPVTLFNKGSLHFKRKEFAKAEEEYRKVLKISPRDVEAAQNLGAIFILQKRLDDAEKLNRWVIEQAPRDEDTLENAYFNLGIIYDKQKKQREALDMYKLALQVSPWDAAAYVNAAVILEKLGRTAEALAYWEKFSRLFPASKRQAEVKRRVEALKKILAEETPGQKPKPLPPVKP